MWIPPTSGNAWQACTAGRVAQETVSKTTQEEGGVTAEECKERNLPSPSLTPGAVSPQ